MKKSVFLITILLSLLITTKAKALSSIAIKDVQMECIYTGGTSIIYDGNEMYISDSASESDNANNSIPITNKYLLGSTKFLKNTVFSSNGVGFKCPDKLASAKILNTFGSGEENKSYSEYFFSYKDGPIDYYKYIIFFSIDQINKLDNNKITINNNSVKIDEETYESGKPGNGFGKKALERNKAVAGEDKAFMTLEDIYGVGYAVKARTEKTGWWFFGDDDGTTYVNSIQKMVNLTKISNTRSLINEKVFVSNYVDSAVECNYMTESSQVISTNLFITVNVYPNGMMLIEGNYGTTTFNGGAFDKAKLKAKTTTKKLTNTNDCPSVVYSKFPTSKVEYGKTNPTISYENIRYDIKTNSASGYIKMSLLPEGESIERDNSVDVCKEYLPNTVIVLKEIIVYITILIPIGVILLILIDYISVIKANSDEFDEKNKRQLKRIKTRLALIVFFLLLQPIINFILQILYNNGIIEVSNINCLFF